MADLGVFLPDGRAFPFWDDATTYTRVYHVAREHPQATDEGPGSEERPFATIGRAAAVLGPGEKVVVHRGVYRECVRPARGGEGADRMIAYETARDGDVIVCGSETWTPRFEPSEGWDLGPLPHDVTVWTAALPAEWFVGYNPFLANNFSSEYTTFTRDWTPEETHVFMLRRGTIYADGRPLKQVLRASDLGSTDGAFWVEDPGLRVHLRLWNDADPSGATYEVTAREQVFAPATRGLGYIRVSGFRFHHAADGIPVPQRAMVSASGGHHWIIEDNAVRWANACGIDVGNETWHRGDALSPETAGRHIIRRNYVADCGICGIAAVGNNTHTLVEDNLVERIGDKGIERIWETAGCKLHTCDGVLIRRNVFRHMRHAPGLWLDYLNRNTRVTGNVLADIEAIHGGIYLEVSHAPNVIDHNILWDIRGTGRPGSGTGINVDTGEEAIVAHNLLAKIPDEYAVSANLAQKGRVVGGRVGLCRRNRIVNNLFFETPHRILLARASDNNSNGNLFDQRDDATSLCIVYPEPPALLDLEAWREYYDYDRSSRQAWVQVEFDLEALLLTLTVEGELPECRPVPALHDERECQSPGPVPIGPGRREYRIQAGRPVQVRPERRS